MNIQQTIVTAALFLCVTTGAGAAEKTAQQQKMTVCHQQAAEKALTGEVRKTFMSECLKKDSNIAEMTPQQIKMKSCHAQAGKKMLKGDERKTFMSDCLKKS